MDIGHGILFLTLVCAAQAGNVTYPRSRGYDLISDEALRALFKTTNGFLENVVQTKDLRWLEERGVNFTNFDGIYSHIESHPEMWTEYFIGYIILVSLGVILLLTMPIIGVCTCCCRCCGKCGATVKPKDHKSSRYKRTCYGTCLFVLVIVIALAGVATILSGIQVQSQIEVSQKNNVFDKVADSLIQLDSYKNQSVDEIEVATLTAYIATKEDVFFQLDNFVEGTINMLDNKTGAVSTLNELLRFTNEYDTIINLLASIEFTNRLLAENHTALDTEINNIQTDLPNILAGCTSEECSSLETRVNSLKLNHDYNTFDIASIKAELENIDVTTITSGLEAGNAVFEDMKGTINGDVDLLLADVKTTADDVEKEINQFLDLLKENAAAMDLSSLADDTRQVDNDIEMYVWDVTYWGLVTPGIVMCLICFCMLIGLMYGLCCKRPKVYKDDACYSWKMGSYWLTASLVLVFVFYWLFLILVTAFFTLGGTVHTELCRHLVDIGDSPVADIVSELIGQYENQDFEVNITEIYKNCEKDMALYTALKIDQKENMNITSLLDLSSIYRYMEDLKGVDIDIGTVELLNEATIDALDGLSIAVESLKVFLLTLETELTISGILNDNLIALADEFLMVAEATNTPESAVETAETLKSLNDNFVVPMETMTSGMLKTIDELQSVIDGINVHSLVLDLIEAANVINSDGNDLIKEYISSTSDSIYGEIDNLAMNIDRSIRYDVAKCYPVFDSYVLAMDSVCVEVLYPLNGYWFAMGACLILLLPCIIVAFKLITLYRKTLPYYVIEEGRETSNSLLLTNQPNRAHVRYHSAPPIENPVYMTDDVVDVQYVKPTAPPPYDSHGRQYM